MENNTNTKTAFATLATLTGANTRDGSKTAERKEEQRTRYLARMSEIYTHLKENKVVSKSGKEYKPSFATSMKMAFRYVELACKLDAEACLPGEFLKRYNFEAEGVRDALLDAAPEKVQTAKLLQAFGFKAVEVDASTFNLGGNDEAAVSASTFDTTEAKPEAKPRKRNTKKATTRKPRAAKKTA